METPEMWTNIARMMRRRGLSPVESGPSFHAQLKCQAWQFQHDRTGKKTMVGDMDNKLTLNVARTIVQGDNCKMSHIIIQNEDEQTNVASKKIQSMDVNRIEIFSRYKVAFDYEAACNLDMDNFTFFDEELDAKLYQSLKKLRLPVMLQDDSLIRYLGLKPGDIFMVISEKRYYRVV